LTFLPLPSGALNREITDPLPSPFFARYLTKNGWDEYRDYITVYPFVEIIVIFFLSFFPFPSRLN